MCGGLKPSQHTKRAKDAQIEREMARLAKLRQGLAYTWPFTTGARVAVFGGHARSENLESVWSGRIKEHVKIEADTFLERNTVDGSNKFVEFKMPAGKAIKGIITTDGDLRIVTKEASDGVEKIHHRMPLLVDSA